MFSFMFQFGAPTAFKQVLRQLESGGIIYFLTDLLLPLMLIFTLMFAILQKVSVFKKDVPASGGGAGTTEPNTKINGTISFIIALLVVIPHLIGAYHPTKDPIIILKSLLPGGVLILVSILILLAVIYLTSGKTPSILTFLVAITGIFFLFYVIASAVFPNMGATMFGRTSPLKNPATQVLIIAILIAALWLWFLLKPPKEADYWEKMGYLSPIVSRPPPKGP